MVVQEFLLEQKSHFVQSRIPSSSHTASSTSYTDIVSKPFASDIPPFLQRIVLRIFHFSRLATILRKRDSEIPSFSEISLILTSDDLC